MSKEFLSINKKPANEKPKKPTDEIEILDAVDLNSENPEKIPPTEAEKILNDEQEKLDTVELPKNPEKKGLMKKYEKLVKFLTVAAMIQGGVLATNIEKAEAGGRDRYSIGSQLERGAGRSAGRSAGGAIDAFGRVIEQKILNMGGIQTRDQVRQQRESQRAMQMQLRTIERQFKTMDQQLERQLKHEKNPTQQENLKQQRAQLLRNYAAEVSEINRAMLGYNQ